jgi:hypothetical protein
MSAEPFPEGYRRLEPRRQNELNLQHYAMTSAVKTMMLIYERQ